MAITIVGQGSAAATSVAIPAHQAGDMIIVSARGTAAAPVVPAAGGTVPSWQTQQSALANSIGLTTVAAKATAANHTTGTFTSATHICVIVFRAGVGSTLDFGTSSTGNANNTQTIVYPALTLTRADGTSMGVRIGTRTVAVAAVGTAPTNWTQRVIQPATPLMAVHTRAALAANPIADTVTTSGTNAASRAHTVEIEEITPVTHFGVVSRATTLGAATAGVATTPAVTHYGATSMSLTCGTTVAGRRKVFGAVSLPVIVARAALAQRQTFGAIARPMTLGAIAVGQRKTFGIVVRSTTFAAVVQAIRVVPPQIAVAPGSLTFNYEIP